MTALLIEGFDHYQSGLMTAKGWSANPTSMQTGRLGGQCARVGGTGIPGKSLAASTSDVTLGFAFRWNNPAQSNADREVAFIRAGTTGTFRLRMSGSTNRLFVLNSSGTQIGDTGLRVLAQSVWYYIEIRGVVNGASGTVEVHVNGAEDIPEATGNFGSSAVTNIQLQGPGGLASSTWDFDDVYVINDGVFLGDCRVEVVELDQDGTYDPAFGGWTPLSGSVNKDMVDEALADGDTTYTEAIDVGDRATFDVTSPNLFNGAVIAVQFVHYARKTTSGNRSIATVVSMDNATFFVGADLALSTSYAFLTEIYDQDPTATDWTKTSLAAGEYGFEITV